MGFFRKARASTKAFRRFALIELVIFVAMLVCIQGNWYILSPTRCIDMETGESTNFDYAATTTEKLYIKLKHGVCESIKSDVYKGCIAWDDASQWNRWDDLNDEVGLYVTDLTYDADTRWYASKVLVIISIVLGCITFLYYLAVGLLDPVTVELHYQYAAAATQILIFVFLLTSVSLGLITDTVHAEAWKVYYYGCDVASWPGAGWWGAVVALWLSLLLAQLIAFPYIGKTEWTNTSSRRSADAHVADISIALSDSASQRSISEKRSGRVTAIMPVPPTSVRLEAPVSPRTLSLRQIDRMSFYFDDNESEETNDPYN